MSWFPRFSMKHLKHFIWLLYVFFPFGESKVHNQLWQPSWIIDVVNNGHNIRRGPHKDNMDQIGLIPCSGSEEEDFQRFPIFQTICFINNSVYGIKFQKMYNFLLWLYLCCLVTILDTSLWAYQSQRLKWVFPSVITWCSSSINILQFDLLKNHWTKLICDTPWCLGFPVLVWST
jgi:hypothetical protein